MLRAASIVFSENLDAVADELQFVMGIGLSHDIYVAATM